MDIGKVSGSSGGGVAVIEKKYDRVVKTPNTSTGPKDADAVKTSVEADFETEQRAKVDRIGAALRDGSYQIPDSRSLASALIGGINELLNIAGK